jgi:ClpX C4-type zinc finger protein
MKCFEITLNGNTVVAGGSDVGFIRGMLFLTGSGRGRVVFRAHVPKGPDRSEDGEWLSERFGEGDELRVRVVESDCPDPWHLQSLHGEGVDPESPLLACSFCRRKSEEVERLIAGGDANICGECVAECVRTLSGEASEPAE